MRKKLEKIYELTENILYDYSYNDNYDYLYDLLNEEYDFYYELSSKKLIKLLDYMPKGIENYPDYAIAFQNNEPLLIYRRIYNQINKTLNDIVLSESDGTIIEKSLLNLDNKKYLLIQNYDNAIRELLEKICITVDTKFLYFVLLDNKLIDYNKQLLYTNMMFINPYLEEKIFSDKISIDEFVSKEDELYNGLWDNVKEGYNNILYSYIYSCMAFVLDNTIYNKRSDDQELLVNEIYLRTLFNYLDEEDLEKINYNFRNIEFKDYNKKGYDYFVDSFKHINDDKKIIKKIKTQ